MNPYGKKTLDCLELCAWPIGSAERQAKEQALYQAYSEKAVEACIRNHSDLFEWGVSARTAWLTEKGKAAIADRL